MPAVLILEKRNAFPFKGSGKNGGRLFLYLRRPVRLANLCHIMAVNFDCMPAKSTKALCIGTRRVPKHGGPGLTKPVHIDNCNQIVCFLLCGKLRRFPHRTLRKLAIAEKNVASIRKTLHPCCERHAERLRQTLPERACGNLGIRKNHCRVTFETAPETSKCLQLTFSDLASDCIESIQQRRRMSFGKNEPVVVRVCRGAEVRMKDPAEKECGHQFDCRQRRCRVPRTSRGCGDENVPANLPCDLFERRVFCPVFHVLTVPHCEKEKEPRKGAQTTSISKSSSGSRKNCSRFRWAAT